MTEKEFYLGDGLYASFDGFQVRLRAPRSDRDDEVFLDSHTLINFMTWIKEVAEKAGS